MTKAILVVSFGTTYPETRQKTIEACEKAIQRQFKDYNVCRAFTSTVVINRIQKQEGLLIPTVSQALNNLLNEGIKEVYIQPLHIIVGSEYEKIVKQAHDFKTSGMTIHIGQPLLSNMSDYEAVKEILLTLYDKNDKHTATVLMGHGSQHYAFTAYAALDHMLSDSSVFIGCVESYPDIELIEKQLAKRKIKTIHLAPFMLVAGDHATNDMTSDEPDSWYHFLRTRGYDVKTHLVGLGEYKDIQAIYLKHVAAMMED